MSTANKTLSTVYQILINILRSPPVHTVAQGPSRSNDAPSVPSLPALPDPGGGAGFSVHTGDTERGSAVNARCCGNR